MKTLEWVKVVFQNADGSEEAFQVVPKLTSTFKPEPDRTDSLVIVNIAGLPDADRKRLMQCKLPSKISFDWLRGAVILDAGRVEATITPCGGLSFLRGEFTADGFQTFGAGVQTSTEVIPCDVKLEILVVAMVINDEDQSFGLQS